MKKSFVLTLSLLMTVLAVSVVSAEKGGGIFQTKVGDSIYVCACGSGCDCGTMSKSGTQCGCGKELVKATVSKIDKGHVFYKLNGGLISAPVKGKYVCGCGEACNCDTVSQKGGLCGCGKPLVKS